jgi:hypothetical protein
MKSPRWGGHVNIEIVSDVSEVFSVSIIRVDVLSITQAFGYGEGSSLPTVV